MSDQYPRVTFDREQTGRYRWFEPVAMAGTHKVVPANAIVIERGDLPKVEADKQVISGPFARWIHESAEAVAREARHLLAIAEYLTAHPPIDEEQIEATMPYIEDLIESAGGCRDGWDVRAIARRLVEQGWTKPEPTP